MLRATWPERQSVSSPRRRLASLRLLVAVLAGEEPHHGSVRAPGTVAEWERVVQLADELGIGPALWRAASHRGDVPSPVTEGLRDRYRANTIRNARLRRQLRETVEALNRVGIEPLLIKGALQLCDGTLPAAGERWMEDLDIVVPRDGGARTERALNDLGYEANGGKPFLHPHELPFFRARTAGPIEVHIELGSDPIPTVLPVAQAWARSTPLSLEGARARAMCPTDQVLHNVLHSSVQDFNHATGGLPGRQLLVLASLTRAHGSSVDWEAIQRRMHAYELSDALNGYVWLAHRFTGIPLPAGEWPAPSRRREARILSSFALGWPADVQRNLRYAFGRTYLDSLYGHADRPGRLTVARVRHAVTLMRRSGRSTIDHALVRKI